MHYNDLSKIIDYRENITTSSTELLVSFVLKYTDDFCQMFRRRREHTFSRAIRRADER